MTNHPPRPPERLTEDAWLSLLDEIHGYPFGSSPHALKRHALIADRAALVAEVAALHTHLNDAQELADFLRGDAQHLTAEVEALRALLGRWMDPDADIVELAALEALTRAALGEGK